MNLLGYVEKFGSLSFEEKPFNDTDAAIMVLLSYSKFELIVPDITEGKNGIFLHDLTDENISEITKVKSFGSDMASIMKAQRSTKRFGNIVAENCMCISDLEILEQFSAVTFDIPSVGLFVCFRGTDGTLVGWKENFSVLYNDATLSQIDANEYLYQVKRVHPNSSFMIGGHSKGGNLALWCLFFSPDDVYEKISKAYSFDGFGFYTKQFRESPDYNNRLVKLVQIVPRDSIVGELFYTPLNHTIIDAEGKGMIQHNPMNWIEDEEGLFKTIESRRFFTRLLHRTVKKWSQRSSKINYKIFAEILTAAFSGPNGDFDIYGAGSENKLKKIFKIYRHRPFKEKMKFLQLVLLVVGTFLGSLCYYIGMAIGNFFGRKRHKTEK